MGIYESKAVPASPFCVNCPPFALLLPPPPPEELQHPSSHTPSGGGATLTDLGRKSVLCRQQKNDELQPASPPRDSRLLNISIYKCLLGCSSNLSIHESVSRYNVVVPQTKFLPPSHLEQFLHACLMYWFTKWFFFKEKKNIYIYLDIQRFVEFYFTRSIFFL